MKRSKWAIGIDLGGTKIASGLVDPSGTIIREVVIPTNVTEGPEAIVNRLAAVVDDLQKGVEGSKALHLGIAVAGQVEANTGLVFFAPNLNWRNFPLKASLAKKVDLPMVVVNDVRAATLGEWHFGAGKGIDDLVCLFVGTGIGGGIITAGRLLEGSSNSAGELGHMVIDWHGRGCHCGGRGCLEALASGTAIAEIARELIEKNPIEGKAILDAAKGDIKAVSAKEVLLLADKNDPLAVKIIDGVVEALTAGVVTIVNAFNPSRIILGGGIINKMPRLVERIDAGVRKAALKVALDKLSIVQAGLKANAGVVGAAKLASAT